MKVAQEILDLEAAALQRGEAAVGGIAGMEVTPPIVDQARLVIQRAEWSRSVKARIETVNAMKEN